jgi:hypothetical protein
MTTLEWAQFTFTILSVVGVIITSIRWYIKTQIEPIHELVQDIRNETKTNGGSSMRDEIKSIKKDNEEAKQVREEQKQKIDHLYDLFVEYVAKKN